MTHDLMKFIYMQTESGSVADTSDPIVDIRSIFRRGIQGIKHPLLSAPHYMTFDYVISENLNPMIQRVVTPPTQAKEHLPANRIYFETFQSLPPVFPPAYTVISLDSEMALFRFDGMMLGTALQPHELRIFADAAVGDRRIGWSAK